MSQDWVANLYTTATTGDTTLSNMELMFATLRSNFSGGSQPPNNVAGNDWYDTTKKVRKTRDYGNTAWLGLWHGDSSQKLWVYRNSAMEGCAVDSGVTDKVLAIKGGTTYTTGGTNAGAWAISGIAHTHGVGTYAVANHNHQWYDWIDNIYTHDYTYNSAGSQISFGTYSKDPGAYGLQRSQTTIGVDAYTAKVQPGLSGASGSNGSGDGTWRPAASVGTLQYLDLS